MIPVRTIVDALEGQTFPDGPLVAALPMYDWPERRHEVNAEWAELRDALRSAGIAAPERLARCNADLPAVPGGIRDSSGKVIAKDPATLPPNEFDFESLWQHPNLLFSQTCWGPLELWLGDGVRVIGQDDYSALAGGEGDLYSSALVMRRAPANPSHATGQRSDTAMPGASLHTQLAGLRLAYNVADSMSGYMALERDLQAEGSSLDIFADRVISGGHRKSIRMVAAGEADVAAVDCKSWALALEFEPAANELSVVGWTSKRKGLPFITAKSGA